MFKLTMKGLLLLACVSLAGCVEDTQMWNDGYSVAPNNSVVVTRSTTTTHYRHRRRHDAPVVYYNNAPGVTVPNTGYNVSGNQNNSGYSVH